MSVDLTPIDISKFSSPQQSAGKVNLTPIDINNLSQSPPESGSVNLSKGALTGAGAAIGGIANAEGSALESIGDAGLYVARKLGNVAQYVSGAKENPVISEETSAKYAQNLHSFLKDTLHLFPEEEQNNPLGQAMREDSKTASLFKYSTDALNLIASGTAGKSLLAKGMNVLGNAALSAGIAGGSEENQDMSALLGGGLALAGEAVNAAGALTKYAKSTQLVQNIAKNYLQPIYSKLESDGNLTVAAKALKAEAANTETLTQLANAKYEPIKAIPGTIEQNPIIGSMSQMMKNTNLNEDQIKALHGMANDASFMSNMEDALHLKQSLVANQSLFRGAGVSKQTFNSYKDLINQVRQAITDKAELAGKGDALKEADTFYENGIIPLQESGSIDRLNALKQQQKIEAYNAAHPNQPPLAGSSEYSNSVSQVLPSVNKMTPEAFERISKSMGSEGSQIMQDHLVEQTFKTALSNPETFNKDSALKTVNTIMTKYQKVLSPDTQKTFEGAKILLQEAGATGKSGTFDVIGKTISAHPYITASALAGGAGGIGGYEEGHSLESTVKGLLVGGGIVAGGKGLLNSTLGQTLLRYIADHPETARGVLNSLTQLPAAAVLHQPIQNSGDQNGNS